ncbi:MAG: type II toxin-antitoxin system HicB family antitoxin [Nitrospirae bacterium]|uniref:type II toxin-antitoxin system HicB family antitoxin n=1 Tax=Candidatus Magnetobacterium casense TaxID=1455061 RepID=UPI00058C3365|nr:type II toxin-antitoxin system HicB family antitoxin [Candidatus Magnetobacterium casensis]MBF0337974.1 type II toxin-antitoxin system HicB family antitoxin [Nitrospirota bacterium]
MLKNFTLQYWIDDNWYVGKLKEVPGVFSQGETLEKLEDNIREAYKLMKGEDEDVYHTDIVTKEIAVEV